MFLKVDGKLVNIENVLIIEPYFTSITARANGPAPIEYPAGVKVYFTDGSTSTFSVSMEDVVDALTELEVML